MKTKRKRESQRKKTEKITVGLIALLHMQVSIKHVYFAPLPFILHICTRWETGVFQHFGKKHLNNFLTTDSTLNI